MKLQELLRKLREVKSTMETFHAKSMTETDKAKREIYSQSFDEAAAEAETIKAQIIQAKALESVNTTVSDIEDEESPDLHGKSVPPPSDKGNKQPKAKAHPADALIAGNIEVVQNEMKDEFLRRHHFFRYCSMGAKALNEEGRNCLSPEARGRQLDEEYADAVMMPKSVVYNMFPGVEFPGLQEFSNPMGKAMLAMGKTMLSTDATGQAVDSGTAFTIAPDFRATVQQQPVYMPMIIDKVQMAPAVNGKAIWPKLDQGQGNFGGVAFTWKAAEGLDKGETEPTFGEFEVDTHELSGWTAISLRSLRRSTVQLESFLTTLFRNAARYEWSKQIMRGDGSNKPFGLVPYAGINDINRLVANQVSFKDLVNLEYAISKGNRTNAMYIMEDSVEGYLVGTVSSNDDRPLFQDGTAGGRRDKVNSYLYDCHEFGPELGTEGDVIFGNMMNYIFGMEEDIAIARSDHAEFKKGLVVFRLICYVGGKPLHAGAFSRLTDAAGG